MDIRFFNYQNKAINRNLNYFVQFKENKKPNETNQQATTQLQTRLQGTVGTEHSIQ